MANRRKAIHAYVSDEAHETWHDLAATNGVSVSGLLEAIAGDWQARLEAGADLSRDVEALAHTARKIDAARRRRRGQQPSTQDCA